MAVRWADQQQPLEHRLLLTATFCLLAGGAVMVYSASSARTLLQGQGDGTAYLIKYVAYGAIGLIAMHLVSRLTSTWSAATRALLLVAAFVMLAAGRSRASACGSTAPAAGWGRPAAVPAERRS